MPNRQQEISKTLRQFYDQPIAQVSLELFFSIIAVIFFALFAIRPTLITMADLVKEIQDKKDLNQKLSQKVAALSSVQGEYLGLQDRLKVLDEAIPSSPRFDEAVSIIEKIASENHLTIISLEAKEIPKEEVQNLPLENQSRLSKPLTVSVIGDYPSIRQFIDSIRSTRREISVDSILFNLSDERGKKILRANITLSIHYFGLDNAQAQKAAAAAATTPSSGGTPAPAGK
jgi:Tfp pilus assembly protein PilO